MKPLRRGRFAIAGVVLDNGRARLDHSVLAGLPKHGRRVVVVVDEKRFVGIAAGEDDPGSQISRALSGGTDLTALHPNERALLRAFLQSMEPVRWERTPRSFRQALTGSAGPS